MSLASHSDCASNGAHQARKRASSLDSRRRIGSAGDAALSMEARDRLIIRKFLASGVQSPLVAEFGLSRARISIIIGSALSPELRNDVREQAMRERFMRRSDEALALYECGFFFREISDLMGCSEPTVSGLLAAHPDYEPRRCVFCNWRKINASEWVPTRHRERFQKLASGNGRGIASSCIRAMLTWEAR